MSKKWEEEFDNNKELILSSCSKDCTPRSIVVISRGYKDNLLLIGVCEMQKTLKNLEENPFVSLFTKMTGIYLMALGKVTIHTSGKLLNVCKDRSNPPLPKKVLAVKITEVNDLDTGVKLF